MGQERRHCTVAFEDLGSQPLLQKSDLVELPGLVSSDLSRCWLDAFMARGWTRPSNGSGCPAAMHPRHLHHGSIAQ